MIKVRAPDGTIIQFPDNTSLNTIDGVMRSYHQGATPLVKAVTDAKTQAAQGGDAGGAMAILNGWALGHAPEFRAAGQALRTGTANLIGRGPGYGMGDAYTARKGVDQRLMQTYASDHPVASLAANLGGGVVNPISLAGGEWASGARGLIPTIARTSAVGGVEGGIAGGPRGALAGAALGALIPVGGAAAGKMGQTASNVSQNLLRLLGMTDPQSVAARRLAAALGKDVKGGADPNATLGQWPGASQPTLADIGGENVRAEIRNAGTQGPARTALADYQRKTAADLQGHALTLTDQLPGPQMTAPAARQGAQTVLDGATGYTPTVQPGSGGAALSAALNERAGIAKQAVDAAYAAARAAGPEKAQLQADALPGISSAVRDAVSDFSPKDIPRVTGNLNDMDLLSSPTVRDLFEVRSRLANLRASNDPVEAAAAGKATRALDSQIDQADTSNLISGDPQAVNLWKDAIAHRRMYGQMFEGGDLIHDLTAQDLRGGGRNLVIAPEDASNAILGRSGVSPSANLTRDFGRITDMLGPDHPAVQAVQNEAADRLLSADAGSPKFGTAIQGFAAKNPDLSQVLIPPDVLEKIAARQGQIADATGDLGAVDTGAGLLRTSPDQFAATIPADRIPLLQVGGKQALTDKIGAPTEGAIGALNTISTGTNPGRNLAMTFGDNAADDYRRGLQAEVSRMENANWMAPQLGAKTHTSGQDAHNLLHIPGMIMNVAKTVLGGGPLSEAERSAIVTPGIGDLSPELLTALLKVQKPPPFLQASGYAVGPVASTTAQAMNN